MAIQFKELKACISRVVRISICFLDGHYDNYTLISDIPQGKYDDLYVYGIGMIDVEFPKDVYGESKAEPFESIKGSEVFLGCGLEIVLTEEPRDDIGPRHREEGLLFADVKEYLQIGRHFSVVRKEDWTSEKYEWKEEIPEKYDEMFVYGIGIEMNRDEIHNPRYANAEDSSFTRQMTLVLSKTPREF